MKKLLIVLLIGFVLIFAGGGCWSRKEPNEVSVVHAVGVDRRGKEFWLTAQIVRPRTLFVPGGGGGLAPRVKPVWTISVSGRTLFEAMRNLGVEIPRLPIFSHMEVLVIGEELARSGLYPILDRLGRAIEWRFTVWPFVCPGEARQLLSVEEGELEPLPGKQIEGLIRGRRWLKSYPIRFYEFLDAYTAEDREPFLPVLQMVNQQGKKTPTRASFSVKKTGIFRDDCLVGFFDEQETRGLLYLHNKVWGEGSILVPSPLEEEKKVSLRLTRARVKVKPLLSGDRLKVLVEVDQKGDLVQAEIPIPLTPELFKSLERRFAEAVRQEILAAVKRAQDLNSDCLGFGAAFHRRYPKQWKTLKKDWDHWFPRLEVEVLVKAKLHHSGLATELLR